MNASQIWARTRRQNRRVTHSSDMLLEHGDHADADQDVPTHYGLLVTVRERSPDLALAVRTDLSSGVHGLAARRTVEGRRYRRGRSVPAENPWYCRGSYGYGGEEGFGL